MANVIENWNDLAVHRQKKKVHIPHASYCLRDGMWKGYPAVILGGGPSLGPLIPRLKEFPTETRFVGVNQSWRIKDPRPTVVYAIDAQVLDAGENDYREEWYSASQIRITHHSNRLKKFWRNTFWIHQVSHTTWGTRIGDGEQKEEPPEGVISGNNSGMCALNLATILGASPIILLGFDGMRKGEPMHYHQDYQGRKEHWIPKDPVAHWENKWKRLWEKVAPLVDSVIYNANRESLLDVFPKVSFEEAVKLCHPK